MNPTITFVDAFEIVREHWGDKAIVWVSARYPGKYTGPRYFVGTQGIFGLMRPKGQGKSWRAALKDAGISCVSEAEMMLHGNPMAEPPKGILDGKAGIEEPKPETMPETEVTP